MTFLKHGMEPLWSSNLYSLYLRKSFGLLLKLELGHLGKLLKPHAESKQNITIGKFNFSEVGRQTLAHLFCSIFASSAKT